MNPAQILYISNGYWGSNQNPVSKVRFTLICGGRKSLTPNRLKSRVPFLSLYSLLFSYFIFHINFILHKWSTTLSKKSLPQGMWLRESTPNFLAFLNEIMKLLYMSFDLHTPVLSANIGFHHLQTDFEAFLIDKLAAWTIDNVYMWPNIDVFKQRGLWVCSNFDLIRWALGIMVTEIYSDRLIAYLLYVNSRCN